MTELEKQVEAAFDYRGHVTVNLKDGKKVEGYLYNRQFESAMLKVASFVELYVKGSGERVRHVMADIECVSLTGDDCAAGNSYEDYLKLKKDQKSQPKN